MMWVAAPEEEADSIDCLNRSSSKHRTNDLLTQYSVTNHTAEARDFTDSSQICKFEHRI